MIPLKLQQQPDLAFVICVWFRIRGEISRSMIFVVLLLLNLFKIEIIDFIVEIVNIVNIIGIIGNIVSCLVFLDHFMA
jgi:hypothetical protein